MLINIKTRHFHSSINHQEQFFHRTLITGYFHPVNIVKFLRTGFFIAHLQKKSFGDILKIDILKVLQTSQESTCVGVSFLETSRLKAWNFKKKDSNTGAFLWSLKFKNTFSYRTPLVTASAPLVAASVFCLKSAI